MNFLYDDFPNYTVVKGNKYEVVTDFRNYIQLTEILREKALTDEEKWFFIINSFYKNVPNEDGLDLIEGIIAFATMDIDYFEKDREIIIDENNEIKELIDYKQDAGLIISSFLQYYNIDLTTIKYLHHWKFKMLLENIDDKSKIGQVISIRNTSLSDIKDKNERKRIRKLQNIYRIKRQFE